MPIVTVKLCRGRTLEQKRKLVKKLTAAVVEVAEVKAEWATVLIEEYDRENWASEGRLHCDRYGKGCGKAGTDSSGPVSG